MHLQETNYLRYTDRVAGERGEGQGGGREQGHKAWAAQIPNGGSGP